MRDPKDCKDHAQKCSRLAENLPEGRARQLFAEMATTWLRLAIEAEETKARLDQLAAQQMDQRYRFGSRVAKKDHRRP
jgi:hypothetical protein